MQVLDDDARERGITDERCFAPGREAAWTLFAEYLTELGEDLSFQGVEEELRTLPGKYGPPYGALFVLWRGDEPLACGAIRPLPRETDCELKRLYVRPSARGEGIARAVAETLLAAARNLGYARVRLDTLERLVPANRLYASLGFRPSAPYYDNPLPGVLFLSRDL